MNPASSASAVADHGGHLALLVAVLAGLAVAATVADLAARRRAPVPSAVLGAALFSSVAAAVHASVAPAHLREAKSVGAFFVVAAATQILWSVLVLIHPERRRILALAVLSNIGVLALWALTRTIGVPLGPDAGTVEQIAAADLTASIAELGLVVLLSRHLRSHASSQPTPPAAMSATPTSAAAIPRS